MADILQTIDLAVARLNKSLQCIYLNHINLPDLSRHRGPKRYLSPIGSYAVREWKAGDDIHLVCMGDNSSYVFWDVVGECVPGSGITKIPAKDCHELPMRALLTPTTEEELDSYRNALGSTRFFLHYCLTPASFPLPNTPHPAIPDYPPSYRNEAHKQALQRVQDARLAVAFSPLASQPIAPSPISDQLPSSPLSPTKTSTIPTPPIPPSNTFTIASCAISRLKWDPQHSHIDYEVGYQDRFAGIMWLTLQQWGTAAVEDEDFIPEHRVWYIKRSVSQIVVWDRKGRRDWTHIVW